MHASLLEHIDYGKTMRITVARPGPFVYEKNICPYTQIEQGFLDGEASLAEVDQV